MDIGTSISKTTERKTPFPQISEITCRESVLYVYNKIYVRATPRLIKTQIQNEDWTNTNTKNL